MSDLIKDLKIANKKGLNPPQNWTHRAIEELEKANKGIQVLADAVEGLFSIWCIAEHALEEADYKKADEYRQIANKYKDK